ncbi:MAG: hypothetical protein Q4F23_05380 [Coriobacteriia bacterium]|nr:hypothetical protein [Coriobacteriia bacterium]
MDCEKGQMTIEFVVVFPVLLVVALIAVNVLLFLSECAGFDRSFRQEVARLAPSPGYGQGSSEIAGKVESELTHRFDRDYVSVSVSASAGPGGLVTYRGILHFSPTLFGHGSLKGAFGVSFPGFSHAQELVVDQYRPGVLL